MLLQCAYVLFSFSLVWHTAQNGETWEAEGQNYCNQDATWVLIRHQPTGGLERLESCSLPFLGTHLILQNVFLHLYSSLCSMTWGTADRKILQVR